MAHSAIHLTQSKYYSPAFNAAVFDGPIRIYFAQHQEALALKVYFQLQQYLKEKYAALRKEFKNHGQTIFLLLYPTDETFQSSFGPKNSEDLSATRLGDDHVIGVRGPLMDDQFDRIFSRVETILQGLKPPLQLEVSPIS